ncbi:hypothetical protein F4810DRAFT_723710 [Camillea tinctor]|nr:hypothetical protein F4810DRAFT_723710 [Camillea tinctor]
MDPLSLTIACITLLDAAAKTSSGLIAFVRGCMNARGDLSRIKSGLSELSMVLELLKENETINGEDIPENIKTQTLSLVKNCTAVVRKIDNVLEKHKGRAEAHRQSLNMVLDLMAVTMTRAVKENTTAIRADLVDIMQDMSHITLIIRELTSLRAQVGRDTRVPGIPGHVDILQRYLDDLTSYAETVHDEVIWYDLNLGDRTPTRTINPDINLDMRGPSNSRGVASDNMITAEDATVSWLNSLDPVHLARGFHETPDLPPDIYERREEIQPPSGNDKEDNHAEFPAQVAASRPAWIGTETLDISKTKRVAITMIGRTSSGITDLVR